jgi:hypothetical protein
LVFRHRRVDSHFFSELLSRLADEFLEGPSPRQNTAWFVFVVLRTFLVSGSLTHPTEEQHSIFGISDKSINSGDDERLERTKRIKTIVEYLTMMIICSSFTFWVSGVFPYLGSGFYCRSSTDPSVSYRNFALQVKHPSNWFGSTTYFLSFQLLVQHWQGW